MTLQYLVISLPNLLGTEKILVEHPEQSVILIKTSQGVRSRTIRAIFSDGAKIL